MSEKYFQVEYDEEWYLFDSTRISEQLVKEQAEYGYDVFANSLSPSEIVDLLNKQQSMIEELIITIKLYDSDIIEKDKQIKQLQKQLDFIQNMISKCRWCGKLYLKKTNAEQYCSNYCKSQAKLESKRNYINKRNKSNYQYNTRVKNLVTLGSLGTSSSCKCKSSFSEEHISIRKELKRLGLN